MLKKVLLGCAIATGCAAGVSMAWNFHEIIEGNFGFITAHLWISMILGAAFLLMLAKAVFATHKDNPRGFGILMLVTASGIVLQSIADTPASYSDGAHASLILKLAGALILMVNGLSLLHRERLVS
jgi:FtsH-binding integral membrane protein